MLARLASPSVHVQEILLVMLSRARAVVVASATLVLVLVGSSCSQTKTAPLDCHLLTARPARAAGSPSARTLPRISPPYDVASTGAALAAWPRIDPGVETRAMTSFDRSGADDDGFNGTYSQLGADDACGEHIIFDSAGPGVLRTLWFASNVDGNSPLGLGLVRFYFDDDVEPRLAVDADALFHGTEPPFLAPLVEDNRTSTGAFVSWVPLAFREHLRITTSKRASFYQAHYEVLPPDWDVATFSPANRDDTLVARFAATGPSMLPLEVVPLDVTRNGAGEIDVLRFEPSGTPSNETVDAARLQAWFDGADAPQVDVPLGTFFGVGSGQANVRSIVWTMQPGLWESRMPMPYWQSVRLRVTGLDGVLSIHVAPSRFGPGEAGWLTSIAHEERPTTPGQDYVYADVTGAGKLVATVLAVKPIDPLEKRWWEGDLRSRADGLRTPAIQGTGHEDDHLAGWSSELFQRPFTLPMQGEPRSSLLDMVRPYNANTTLYRIWPGIGFSGGLRHSTEHGSANTHQANYASTTFVYRRPSARLMRTDATEVGSAEMITSSFDGESAPALTAAVTRFDAPVAFTLAIDPNNAGVKLRRLYDQSPSSDARPEEARLEVDGFDLGALFVAETNASRRWAERDVFIPPQISRGKNLLEIRVVPVTHLDASRFEAWTVIP